MERPDISPLSQLALGDCFHFAYRAMRDERGEHVPRFELMETNRDFCVVQLKDVLGTATGSPTRLLKTTMVRKLAVTSAEGMAGVGTTPGSLIVQTRVFDAPARAPVPKPVRAAGKNERGESKVYSVGQ